MLLSCRTGPKAEGVGFNIHKYQLFMVSFLAHNYCASPSWWWLRVTLSLRTIMPLATGRDVERGSSAAQGASHEARYSQASISVQSESQADTGLPVTCAHSHLSSQSRLLTAVYIHKVQRVSKSKQFKIMTRVFMVLLSSPLSFASPQNSHYETASQVNTCFHKTVTAVFLHTVGDALSSSAPTPKNQSHGLHR